MVNTPRIIMVIIMCISYTQHLVQTPITECITICKCSVKVSNCFFVLALAQNTFYTVRTTSTSHLLVLVRTKTGVIIQIYCCRFRVIIFFAEIICSKAIRNTLYPGFGQTDKRSCRAVSALALQIIIQNKLHK